jgi:hypothetical protein
MATRLSSLLHGKVDALWHAFNMVKGHLTHHASPERSCVDLTQKSRKTFTQTAVVGLLWPLHVSFLPMLGPQLAR